MAGRKRKRGGKRGGKRRMVCPKRKGKKIRSSGGRCWYKTYVKKVSAKKSRKRRKGRRKKR